MEFTNDTDLAEIRSMLFEHMSETYTSSKKSFELWFTDLKLIYLDGNKAVFACDTAIKQNVLLNNYLDFIRQSLVDVIGYSPEIEIKIDPSVAPPNPYNRNFFMEQLKSHSEENCEEAPEIDYNEDDDDGDEETHYTSYTPMSGEGGSRPDAPHIGSKSDEENDSADDKAYAVRDASDDTDHFTSDSEDAVKNEKWRSYIKDYTFENFIVGSSNQFAHASAMNVADHIGGNANPLFIWGPSGLGKTHLMYAIANRALERNPKMKIICIKGEEFTNQLVDAIQKGRNRQFREKFRRCDILMIDDIQFIAGKEATQTEFFHTFDALYEDRKQIILTSDRPPRELESLEQRIRSRFEQGLLADIKPPDYELRMAILKNKINQNHIDVPSDVVDFLAQNLQENIRQLEGVIKKLAMSNLLTGQPVSMEMVMDTVPEYLHATESTQDTVDRIIECVAKRFKLSVNEMLTTSRSKNIKNARNAAMYIIRNLTTLSLPQIGNLFHKDHSTVHSNINSMANLMQRDPVMEATVKDIIKEIQRG